MKKILSFCLLAAIIGFSTNIKAQNEMTLKEKISYALGASNGEYLMQQGVEIDLNTFIKGFSEGYEGKNQFTQEEMQKVFEEFQKMMMAKQNDATNNEKAKGAAFLAENKKNPDVVETASGLQYKVVKMGTGAKPTATDKVKVHYHGTTIDGKVFDSSVERGEPITFPLNGVIKGWTEGVQLMPIGSKFIFYIPSDLAYGDRGAGQDIKPGATLIFEVELLDIEK
ncbi:MAG: FKBP-type peptidyl-prolyl cis-trans isomerase [Bacteroidales bacterium]|nr:FKBP-type peptidyl-prolyl cis-trans isomerase [Bacteroidales bacterium]